MLLWIIDASLLVIEGCGVRVSIVVEISSKLVLFDCGMRTQAKLPGCNALFVEA